MLEELCDLLRNTSLCGLGQSAPNPVLSTLRYFRDEYKAHVEEKTLSGRSLRERRRRKRHEPGHQHQDAEDRRQGLQRPPG